MAAIFAAVLVAVCSLTQLTSAAESTSTEEEIAALKAAVAQLQRDMQLLKETCCDDGPTGPDKQAEDGAVATGEALTTGYIKRCRICFQETEGSDQCQGTRKSCSGWSTSPGWTAPFRDDTDNRSGGCNYQWMIQCRSW